MGRRRDHDDDDNDHDRDPPKKTWGSKTLVFVLGIVGMGVVLLVGGCVGATYYAVKVQERKANVEDARSAVDHFCQTVQFNRYRARDDEKAYTDAAPGLRSAMSFEQFQRFLDANPMFEAHTNKYCLSFQEVPGSGPKMAVACELTGRADAMPPGSNKLLCTFIVADQPGTTWRVEKITVP